MQITGSIRVNLWEPQGGQPRASIEFSRIHEAMVIDQPSKSQGGGQPGAGSSFDDEPPF